MKKILLILLTVFTISYAEEVQSSINYLNKSQHVCVKYEEIIEYQRKNMRCTVDRPYQDVTVDTSVTSEDPYQNDPNCVRLNALKDSRYYKDITFEYKNFGFFNTIIKKVYMNEEEEDFANEAEMEGFVRIDLNENTTRADLVSASEVPAQPEESFEPDLVVPDVPNCGQFTPTCLDYYEDMDEEGGYAGYTRWENPYNNSAKRIHLYYGITAAECRQKANKFSGGAMVGREEYNNEVDDRDYPNDKDGLEFRGPTKKSNSNLDRFNHDYITKLPLDNFEDIALSRDMVHNEFSFNDGQSLRHENYVYASTQCAPGKGKLDRATNSCVYNATVRCDADSSAFWTAARDRCEVNDLSKISKTCPSGGTINTSTDTCSLSWTTPSIPSSGSCNGTTGPSGSIRYVSGWYSAGSTTSQLLINREVCTKVDVPAVTCDPTDTSCTPSPASYYYEWQATSDRTGTKQCSAGSYSTDGSDSCKYTATVTCNLSVYSTYDSSTKTCNFSPNTQCYGTGTSKPSNQYSSPNASSVIDKYNTSTTGTGSIDTTATVQKIGGTYTCVNTSYCPTSTVDYDEGNHFPFDNSATENSGKIDYPHLVTSGHPSSYGAAACGRVYYWYTYHCPVNNSVTFQEGDPEFNGIGPSFDPSGTDSWGYNYYASNPSKRSGVEEIGNPIKSSGTVDCLGTCGADGCICLESEFPETSPTFNCKVPNESTDTTKYCLIEDNDNMCSNEIETTQADMDTYIAEYTAWDALPDDDPSKYMTDENGDPVYDEDGNRESYEPNKVFKFTSVNKSMSLQECDELAMCYGGAAIDHVAGEVCHIGVGDGANVDDEGEPVEPLESMFTPPPVSEWKQVASTFNGLEDIFSVEQVMDGEWGYFSNYLSKRPTENKIKVTDLQISPIEEITKINDPILYSYAHQSDAITTKKPNFLAGALAGGATGVLLMSNPIGWIIAAVIVVFVLVSALFGKEYKLRETWVNWELWKNKTPTYLLNPYGYDNRGIFGATGDAYNPVSVNDSTPVPTYDGVDPLLIGHYEHERNRWLRTKAIKDGNGLKLNRNYEDYLSYIDLHYFTGTQKSNETFTSLLDNIFSVKRDSWLNIGYEESQVPRSEFETKTIPGFPKCKWYHMSCNKRATKIESGTVPMGKLTNTVYLGATNDVSIVVPFAGDYIMKAYDKNDNELGVVLVEEDMWIKESGKPSYAPIIFGNAMELSSDIPEATACRRNIMVEWGGGVSGIYYEEPESFTETTLDTCTKSNDDFVRDHSATYLTLSDIYNTNEFIIRLEKPMPFANRAVLVTLNEKEEREYRCFGEWPECGVDGENNEPPQEFLDNPELFTPTNSYDD